MLLFGLRNGSDVVCDPGNELRPRFVVATITGVKIFVTMIYQNMSKRLKDPAHVWRHGDRWKASQNQQGL
jgi:hypothetical protein